MNIKKKIFVIEDYRQLEFMRELLSNKQEYELTCEADLSDDRVFKRHLPEDYDLYWLHGPAVDLGAIPELREKQPWSKIVVRNSGGGEASLAESYLREHKIDLIISRQSGLNEGLVLNILQNLWIDSEARK